MIPLATVTCDGCSGRGLVPHQKRTVEDGKADPWDYQEQELCGKCGGTGRMTALGPGSEANG